MSVPCSAAHLPGFYNGKDHGYRDYVDQPASARHPFGHGLSYTTVSYGVPKLSRTSVPLDAPTLTCAVAVTNTGHRPVCETVHRLYLRRTSGGSSWPRTRELRGFARVRLAPGETAKAVFDIDADTLGSVTRDLTMGMEALTVGGAREPCCHPPPGRSPA